MSKNYFDETEATAGISAAKKLAKTYFEELYFTDFWSVLPKKLALLFLISCFHSDCVKKAPKMKQKWDSMLLCMTGN